MWKGIRELVDLLLLWGFWYLGSFKEFQEQVLEKTL